MHYCDLSNLDNIRTAINYLKTTLNVCGIVSFVDPFCGPAAQLAKEFGIENFSINAMYKMHNKVESRAALVDTPFNPKYRIFSPNNFEAGWNIHRMLPVVVKYIDSNGSKDVYYCHNMLSYQFYTNKLFSQYPGGTILVEEFLEGPQYIVEILVNKDKINIVAIVEQEITFINDHFIITGYNLCLDYSKINYSDLKTAVETIIANLHLENGPCHLEMRYVRGSWKLIEANPRISGGGMNQLLKIGLGINLVEETLKLALNQKIDLEPKHKKHTFAEYVILSESGKLRRITGKEQVVSSPGVEFIYVKPRKGSFLSTPTSLGNRYAYVIATGSSEQEAKRNAKVAASKIIFHLE